jgi:hypothetical protein
MTQTIMKTSKVNLDVKFLGIAASIKVTQQSPPAVYVMEALIMMNVSM